MPPTGRVRSSAPSARTWCRGRRRTVGSSCTSARARSSTAARRSAAASRSSFRSSPAKGRCRSTGSRARRGGRRWGATVAASATFELTDSPESRAVWPHAFAARVTVTLRPEVLEVALAVENRGREPLSFTAALHTYLAMDDAFSATVSGLAGLSFRDSITRAPGRAARAAASREGRREPSVCGRPDQARRAGWAAKGEHRNRGHFPTRSSGTPGPRERCPGRHAGRRRAWDALRGAGSRRAADLDRSGRSLGRPSAPHGALRQSPSAPTSG